MGFHRSALHPFSILVLTLAAYLFFFASRVEKTSIGPVSWEVSYLAIGEAGSSSWGHLQRHLAAAKAFEAPPRSSRCWVFFRTVFQKYLQRHQNPVAFELLSKNTWNSETQCHRCTRIMKKRRVCSAARLFGVAGTLENYEKFRRSQPFAFFCQNYESIRRWWMGGWEPTHLMSRTGLASSLVWSSWPRMTTLIIMMI